MVALLGHPTSLVPAVPKQAARHDPLPAISKCPPGTPLITRQGQIESQLHASQ